MKRTEVMKRLRAIAKTKRAEMTTTEGGNHTLVMFDGVRIATVPRHNEINEHTARSITTAAEGWTKGGG